MTEDEEVFNDFKTKQIEKPGFYVFRWDCGSLGSYERQYEVWSVTHHHLNSYSYGCTSENTRDENTCHDFGIYNWVNSYSVSHGPTHWREMKDNEVEHLKSRLYGYNRPKWQKKGPKLW